MDFSKAFDSINRETMKEILLMYLIPVKLVNAIMSLYSNTRSSVRIGQSVSDSFETKTGVLQGDTLAPFLFIIVLDYVLRLAFPDSSDAFHFGALSLCVFAFADDLALIAGNPEDAQRLLTRLHNAALRVGLQINIKKTKVLHLPKDTNFTTMVDNEVIESVDDFKYLGVTIFDSRDAFLARKKAAWCVVGALNPILRTSISTIQRVEIFKALVESTLLYGMEAMTLTDTLATLPF